MEVPEYGPQSILQSLHPACPRWHRGIAVSLLTQPSLCKLHIFSPPLLKIKQSFRALLTGSDISQVQINTPLGPEYHENQLIACASLSITAPRNKKPQYLPVPAGMVYKVFD